MYNVRLIRSILRPFFYKNCQIFKLLCFHYSDLKPIKAIHIDRYANFKECFIN